jgi:hypothetical protein
MGAGRLFPNARSWCSSTASRGPRRRAQGHTSPSTSPSSQPTTRTLRSCSNTDRQNSLSSAASTVSLSIPISHTVRSAFCSQWQDKGDLSQTLRGLYHRTKGPALTRLLRRKDKASQTKNGGKHSRSRQRNLEWAACHPALQNIECPQNSSRSPNILSIVLLLSECLLHHIIEKTIVRMTIQAFNVQT